MIEFARNEDASSGEEGVVVLLLLSGPVQDSKRMDVEQHLYSQLQYSICQFS